MRGAHRIEHTASPELAEDVEENGGKRAYRKAPRSNMQRELRQTMTDTHLWGKGDDEEGL
eukprot:9114271-Alexandrium_andersonii.AAC.1